MQWDDIAPEDLAGEAQLRAYLAGIGLDARVLAPGVPMPTVPLAAAAIGVSAEQIIKSVVFTDRDRRVILGIASGTARIDRAKLAALLGVPNLKLAPPEAVRTVTGYRAGGVAPIGHRTPIPVVVDRRVLAHPLVYGGGGSELTLVELSPATIIALTAATIADIITIDRS